MKVRFAVKEDSGTLLEMIRELAQFEKLEHEVIASVEQIEKSLFGERRMAEALIAENQGVTIGFALFFHSYSTFLAKSGVYLEDLYVRSGFRRAGCGRLLLARLAQIAVERGCGRMEWSVLNWNSKAISLYENLGAKPMSDWTTYRLTDKALLSLASSVD